MTEEVQDLSLSGSVNEFQGTPIEWVVPKMLSVLVNPRRFQKT